MLVRRSFEAPALLSEADLDPLREAAGDSALTYACVLGAFHYINRIADLLHVDSEFLPESALRFGSVRRIGVFFATRLLRRMDLRNRHYTGSFETECDRIARRAEKDVDVLARELAALRPRPWLIEVLRLSLEERERALLETEEVARVHALVEEFLPRNAGEAEGFHPRPDDALEAFVFVGTRYAARTTPDMITALRRQGASELRILDLAHTVADANQWARVRRLLGLPHDLLTPTWHQSSTITPSCPAIIDVSGDPG
ncbi:MAG TPA: hypothetical protein VN634_10675 [Candidatus Limnocylindrales bacterium]|nr:hypothetical protein [Candidatus Limnocylindrales bacterium]